MAKRSSKKADASAQATQLDVLLAALKFVSVAQSPAGLPWTRHCILFDDHVYATNGLLSAGCPVGAHMQVAPHTAKLIAALQRCTTGLAFTMMPSSLVVRSERFRATVPCHVLADMPPFAADPPGGVIDDAKLRAALAAVSPLVSESGQRVMQTAVYLAAGSATATNGMMAMEYWHGIDLPPMLIPKASVVALLGIDKPITQLGYSGRSATFYFADGSWLKTQLYAEEYPDVGKVLNVPSSQWPVPPEFFDALKILMPFVTPTRGVVFSQNKISTLADADLGTSYELPGIPAGHAFNIDMLMHMQGLVKTADFGKAYGDKPLLFFGENLRGALARMHLEPRTVNPGTTAFDDMDADIPF